MRSDNSSCRPACKQSISHSSPPPLSPGPSTPFPLGLFFARVVSVKKRQLLPQGGDEPQGVGCCYALSLRTTVPTSRALELLSFCAAWPSLKHGGLAGAEQAPNKIPRNSRRREKHFVVGNCPCGWIRRMWPCLSQVRTSLSGVHTDARTHTPPLTTSMHRGWDAGGCFAFAALWATGAL